MGAIQQSILSMIGATTQAVGINKFAKNSEQGASNQAIDAAEKHYKDLKLETTKLADDIAYKSEHIKSEDKERYEKANEWGFDNSTMIDIVGGDELKAIRALEGMRKKRSAMIDQTLAAKGIYEHLKAGKQNKLNDVSEAFKNAWKEMRGKEINNG